MSQEDGGIQIQTHDLLAWIKFYEPAVYGQALAACVESETKIREAAIAAQKKTTKK